MTVTNELGLPEAFVNAVTTAQHNEPGHYSATTLNKGAKEIMLTKRHWNELTVDAADCVWQIFGTAVHEILEKTPGHAFKEEFFKVPVSNSFVTGKIDSYDLETGEVVDWKTASIWKVQFKDFEDWRHQGMIYAWLLTQHNLPCNKVSFIALLKDHSKTKARNDSEYPQRPVVVYSFKVTDKDLEAIDTEIQERVKELEAMETTADDAIPECSEKQRWADNAKFAVMKEGRKTAVKLFDNQQEAEEHAAGLGPKHSVVFRPGTSRKCLEYCQCKDFCNFYKK